MPSPFIHPCLVVPDKPVSDVKDVLKKSQTDLSASLDKSPGALLSGSDPDLWDEALSLRQSNQELVSLTEWCFRTTESHCVAIPTLRLFPLNEMRMKAAVNVVL